MKNPFVLKLDEANRPKRNSKDVQDVLLPKLDQLGFSSEAKRALQRL